MRKTLPILFCFFLIIPLPALGQGKIEWSSGYPKPGSTTGTITVRGTVTVDTNWSVKDDGVYPFAWISGKGLKSFALEGFEAMSKNWEKDLSLTSGSTYNLVVEVVLTSGTQTVTLRTKPGSAKAK